MHNAPQFGEGRHRIAGGAQNHAAVRHADLTTSMLGVRDKDFRIASRIQSVLLHIADHADDRDPGALLEIGSGQLLIAAKAHAFSNGILSWKIASSEALIDEYDSRRIVIVEVGYVPAARKRYFHCAQVLRAYEVEIHRCEAVLRGRRAALQKERRVPFIEGEGQGRVGSGGLNSRRRLQPAQEFLEKAVDLIRASIAGLREMDSRRQEVLWIEPGLDVYEFAKTANHQAGSDQQQERESEFGNDKNVADPLPRRSRGGLGAVIERTVKAKRMECRNRAEQDTSHQ